MQLNEFTIHPLCALFPYIEEQTFEALKEDIAKYGQRDSIKLYKGEILDGKNRLKCCIELERTPIFEGLPDSTNIVAYVKSVGLHRRDLTSGQRIEIAIQIEEYRKEDQGTAEKIKEVKEKLGDKKILIENSENKRIARDANSNAETVQKFREIKEKGTEKDLERVRSGKGSIDSVHKKVTKEPKKDTKKRIKDLPTPDEVVIEVLKAQVSDYKSEVAYLKDIVKRMIGKFKDMGKWEVIKMDIFPIAEVEENSSFPTVAELRKAELI